MNINLRWQFHIILNRIPIVSTDLAFRFFHWSLSKIAPNVEKAWWQPPDNSMQFSFTILCLQIPWHLTVQPIKRHDPFPILFLSAFDLIFWHFSSVSQVRTEIGPQLRACCVSSSCAFTSISCFPQPLQGDCVCSAPAGRLLPAGLALRSAGALVLPMDSPPRRLPTREVPTPVNTGESDDSGRWCLRVDSRLFHSFNEGQLNFVLSKHSTSQTDDRQF